MGDPHPVRRIIERKTLTRRHRDISFKDDFKPRNVAARAPPLNGTLEVVQTYSRTIRFTVAVLGLSPGLVSV